MRDLDGTYDIGICQDRIERVSRGISEKGSTEIDAAGNFVSPGFVDCHTHMDKSFAGAGGRVPKYNDYELPEETRAAGISFVAQNSVKSGLEYFKKASFDEIKRHVIEHAYMQVSNGTLYTRTHVDVDGAARTKGIEAVVEARKELKGLIDIQIVAFPQGGLLRDPESEPLIRKSIEMGADLLGGVNPATVEGDVEKSLDLTFKIAKDYDIGIDSHIAESGALGIYTLERLARKAIENKYNGRIASSHSYSLAAVPETWLNRLIPLFKESGLKFITCYTSTPFAMPIKRLSDAGIPVGCGSDNIRDFWIPLGNGDMVLGALIETQRLTMTTNQDMDLIWNMITTEGAKALNIDKDYGIKVGRKADLVVLDAPSPQWAIITQAKKSYVIKNGKVVAMNGEVLPEFKRRFS